MSSRPMLWIAYDPSNPDPLTNREQFNGDEPAWGDPLDEHNSKQGIDVPMVGDMLSLRMGYRVVESRRMEQPERNDRGERVTGWYWTIIVRK